jgi:hypothetical protein
MDTNRYAPPKADVEGASTGTIAAPALWNPNAAANWSLLFTPVFGAWVQMKNWTALGETQRAESSKAWLIAAAVIILGLIFLGVLMPRSGVNSLSNPVAFLVLIVWYFANARSQAKWVAERFGADYPRRGWAQPLLWGVGAYAAVIVVAAVAGFAAAAAAHA